MTPRFNKYFESMITEYLTASSKRKESRYWRPNQYGTTDIRKVKVRNLRSPSQNVKVDKDTQYVGNPWKNGARHNTSQKTFSQAGIAKGLGGYIKVKGVNPKTPGANVNSKQGNMEVKYNLADGTSRVGSTGKTEYQSTNRNHMDNYHDKYSD